MARFESAYQITMKNEGGYANNPLDRGGETYKGIARNFNPGWSGWASVDAVTGQTGSVAQINQLLGANVALQANVQIFYKTNYWDVNRLDSVVNQDIAAKLFDIGVNSGVGTAAKVLQEALNLTNVNGRAYPDAIVDGRVGPVTLQLVNGHDRPSLLLKLITALQWERYIRIMRSNPSQEVFAASWFSR